MPCTCWTPTQSVHRGLGSHLLSPWLKYTSAGFRAMVCWPQAEQSNGGGSMAGITRRMAWSLLIGAAISLSIGPGLPGLAASEERVVSGEIVVTLLGTGGPEPTAARFGPAT